MKDSVVLLVYSKSKERLVRAEEGWYETGLPWRENHLPFAFQ